VSDLDFLPPRASLPALFVAELRRVLDQQQRVVAAYYVTARFPEMEMDRPDLALQDELIFELATPQPEGPPPTEVVRWMWELLPWASIPPGYPIVYMFPPATILPGVRAAGEMIWKAER
jgi:hypothetical protein